MPVIHIQNVLYLKCDTASHSYTKDFVLNTKLPVIHIQNIFCFKYETDIKLVITVLALTTILPILFLYLNTVTVTAGTFEP